jgi:hypothetical protein
MSELEDLEEGWYKDPFGIHEARWISAGRPTKLVRDNSVESNDDPPSETFDGALEPLGESDSADGSDLLRADTTSDYEPQVTTDAAWGRSGQSMP